MQCDAVVAIVLTIVLSNTTRANVQAVAAAPACADLYVARAQVHLKKDDFTSVMCSLIFCDLPLNATLYVYYSVLTQQRRIAPLISESLSFMRDRSLQTPHITR